MLRSLTAPATSSLARSATRTFSRTAPHTTLVGAALASRRFYVHTSRVVLNETAHPTSPGAAQAEAPAAASPPSSHNTGGQSANESALDVAMRVNKLKKQHQTGTSGSNKKEVEHEAWQALNSLTEDQINNAEGKAVSLLLNSWAYFAKFWAKGKDGPL